MLFYIYMICLPHQHIVLYYCEEFTEEISWLGDQVSFCCLLYTSTAAGTDYNRLNLLMAVLEKRLNLPLSGYDAYVNIAGGVRLSEPAMDLALVLAVISSYKDVPVSDKTIVFGEVGLSGEVRAVSMAKQRVQEAKRLGFTKVILPKSSMDQVKDIKGIELIGVSAVWDAMKCL